MSRRRNGRVATRKVESNSDDWSGLAGKLLQANKQWLEQDDGQGRVAAPAPTKRGRELAERIIKALHGEYTHMTQDKFDTMLEEYQDELVKVECPRCEVTVGDEGELTPSEVSWVVFSPVVGAMVTRSGRVCSMCLEELKAKAQKRAARYTVR